MQQETSMQCGQRRKGKKDESDEDYIEAVVCKESDIAENEKKTFDLSKEGKVLLVRQEGKISALGPECTHYGFALENAILGKGVIRCPCHGACFSITTGDIEDFPGLDSLPCHEVKIENTDVIVKAKKSQLISKKRTKHMSSRSCNPNEHYVIIGGGPAGAVCVETLRQEGFKGYITMVCREPYLPYDRVKISKDMTSAIEKFQFRKADFYEQNCIDVLLGTPATKVDTFEQMVELSNGKSLKYDKLFIATGSKPRIPPGIPGIDMKNIFVLRDFDDAKAIAAQISPEKEVVSVGSSFIALEAANYFVGKVKKVSIVARKHVPVMPVFGERVGARILSLLRENGITYIQNSEIKQCIGENDILKSVELIDGTVLKADILILGTGSSLYTDFLLGSKIELSPDGLIEVNEFLKTKVPNVFAGGDVAYAPIRYNNLKRSKIAHYPWAQQMGRIAALNMLNKNVPFESVPFFWTVLFGKSFRYAGYGRPDQIVCHGDLDKLKFVSFHIDKKGYVKAASGCGLDPIIGQFAEYIRRGNTLKREVVESDDPLCWTKELLPNKYMT